MRLLITRPLPAAVMQAARARFEVTARESTQPLDAAELRAALRDFDLVLPTLGDRFSAEVFADVPQPRALLLANFGVGYNHIDVGAADRAGVAVTNTPGAVTDATADIALTLMLMTARRAGEGERMLRRGDWQGWHPTQLLGLHLTGKRLCVIGMGRIGQAIARRAHFGFAMEISYFSRSGVEGLPFPATRHDGLHAALASADVVVLAVPGGAATRHLIDGPALAAMQPHALLINIARGDVVDEAALARMLAAGRIGGAGLDVYEDEPRVTPGLLALENVTLLPHLGTAALEVREAMGMMALENLTAFAEGRPLPNRVLP